MSAIGDDDAYEKYQCKGLFWGDYHTDVFSAENGNLLLGIARFVAFLVFMLMQWYNKMLLNRRQGDDNVNVIPGLTLPAYLPFVYFYAFFSLVCGVIDVISSTAQDPKKYNFYIYPVEVGMTHVLVEGVAFFLTRYGAGIQAMRNSLKISIWWGILTAVWFYIIFSILYGRTNSKKDDREKTFGMFIAYQSLLAVFYGVYAVIPSTYLYHRPALKFYARFNFLSNIVAIIFGSCFYSHVYQVVCAGSVISFLFSAVLQPLVIFKTLQLDSQYWQGLMPEAGNPLTQVWDHLGIDTAISMAENLEAVGGGGRGLGRRDRLPVLHFGLMVFDTDLRYVAGGFSRVYFGTLRRQRVAFKVLFAMELNPEGVREFYKEASVLHELRHPNVVACFGVCVMPPALTIVLESCKYGSLFDFLYKPVVPVVQTRLSMLRDSFVGTRPNELELRGSMVMSKKRPSQTATAATSNAATAAALATAAAAAAAKTSENAFNPMNSEDAEEGRPNTDVPNPTMRRPMSQRTESQRSHMSTDSRSSRRFGLLDFGSIFQTGYKAKEQVRESLGEELPPVGANLQFQTRLQMAHNAVSAIQHLHSRGYMHCDVKSLNFLVTEDYKLKLADMGEAWPVGAPPRRENPPMPARHWCPPEVLEVGAKADSYTKASDVFGVCVVISEILLAELPYGDTPPDRMSQAAWLHQLSVEKLRPDLPDLEKSLEDSIRAGWATNPADRPSAADLLAEIEALTGAPGTFSAY